MTPATWLMGWAAGLLLVGISGIIAAARGHVPDWNDLYLYLPILVSGTGVGWLAGAALEFGIWSERQRTSTRLDQARAYGLEVEAEIRAASLIAPAMPQKGTATPSGDSERVSALAQILSHWHVFYRRLVAAGDSYGFDTRILTGQGEPTKVTSQPAWNYGTDQLVASGWLVKVRGEGTFWAPHRDYALWLELEGWKALPCPDYEPPDIEAPPYTKQNNRQKQAKQAPRVVEGQARAAD